MQLRGARDRNNPRFLRKQPGKGDLCGGRLLSFADLAEQIDQGLIRFERIRRETRKSATEIGTVERRTLVHLAREESLAQRAVRNKADSEFFESRYHFLL